MPTHAITAGKNNHYFRSKKLKTTAIFCIFIAFYQLFHYLCNKFKC